MTAIEASSARCKTLADGTLQITVNVEPRHAQDAFRLFGAPGVPMALAALKTAAQQQQDQQERPKGGPLSRWLAMRCAEPEFQEWLGATSSEQAADKVRKLLDISSRAELDNDDDARHRFDTIIRRPWLEYQQSKSTA
jgi:hypothetical protein